MEDKMEKEWEKKTGKIKNVLIVNTVPFYKGGISTVIINYYRNIDIRQFNIDFVINREIDSDYEDYILEKGANIFILNRNNNPIKYMVLLYRILKKKKYDIVHIHGNSATMLIDTLPAVMSKVKCRIVHCHNTKCNHPKVSKILNVLFKRTYTKALACSKTAGDWLFGEANFEVLPNGIDVEKYRFSEEIREKVREELGLKDKFVVGHVGFMNEQKNHEKLLAVFSDLRKKKCNAHLLCVIGNSNIPEQIQRLIKEYNLKNNVTVLFQRTDVNRILQAMDVFVFPSRWEGFGMALLEAQTAGLPCVVSDCCIKEINLIGQMKYVSLDNSEEEWIKEIMLLTFDCNREINSEKYILALEHNGYSWDSICSRLIKIYDEKSDVLGRRKI